MFKKKSLGQNFLQAQSYIELIAESAELVQGEKVLEIGPGEGALTRALLKRGAKVVAVEKDHRLIPILTETFEDSIKNKELTLIEADALECDPSTLGLVNGEYKLVANIPYYITGALLRQYLSGTNQPSLLIFLVQKEVAERIAKSAKESLLSLSVKAYGTPKVVKTVPRGAFAPVPNVDSAILLIRTINRAQFRDAKHEERFFTLIHAGFAQKRKLLRSNLATILGEQTLSRMEKAGIPEKARAEDVPLQKWLLLSL